MANLFTLQPHGAFAEGIPADDEGVSFTLGTKTVRIPFYGFVRSPVRNGKVLSARPGFAHGSGEKRLCPWASDYQSALIALKTDDLDFDQGISSHFPNLNNAWPGAESPRGIWFQMGHRGHAAQRQIIIVDPNQPCFMADRDKRYIKVTLVAGRLMCSRAQPNEFGDYLVKRARRLFVERDRGVTPSQRYTGLTWTKYALEALNCRNLWPQEWNALLK